MALAASAILVRFASRPSGILPVMRRWITTFLVGAIAGTLLDQLHVQGNVLGYGSGAVRAGQAWWVPLEFGIAAVALVFATHHHLRAWRVYRNRHPRRAVIIDSAWFVAAYLLTATVGDVNVWAVAAALGAVWLLRIVLQRRPMHVAVFSIGLAVFGTAWEAALSHTGEFTYMHPTSLGVPAWLPFLYAMGAPAACSLVALLERPDLPTTDQSPDLGREPGSNQLPDAAPATAFRRDAMLDSRSS